MFRIRSIAAGVLALGLTAAVPAFARADQFRGDRDDHRDVRHVDRDDHADRFHDDRDEHFRFDHDRDWDHDRDRGAVRIEIGSPIYVNHDVDRTVALCDVPGCVLDTANRARQGPIESVQYVCRDGKEFYRFVIDGRGHDLDMRVRPDGMLLSIEAC